jgi:hypothetical protein
MKQAASMKDLVVPILLPGIKINTSPTDFYPIQAVQLARFDGLKPRGLEAFAGFHRTLRRDRADPRGRDQRRQMTAQVPGR